MGPKPIEIFRPGNHTATNGKRLEFSEDMMAASAAAYDPGLHEAPIVVGHPKSDAPAYGWISGVSYAEGSMTAQPHQVNPDFAEQVRSGAFKKVSASFYPPNSESNPVPGVYYLRHVGFLGAQPPALKGLKQVNFADGDADIVTIEFGEYEDRTVARMFRRLREFILAKHGQEDADNTLPGYEIDLLAEEAGKNDDPAYAEPDPAPINLPNPTDEDEDMDKDAAARAAELEQREDALKQREAQFAEQAAAAHRARIDEFVSGLVDAGKVPPLRKAAMVAFMETLQDGDDSVIEFAEAGEDGKAVTVKKSQLQLFKDMAAAMPAIVSFGEVEGDEDPATIPSQIDVPNGYSVDRDRQRLHEEALAYAERHDIPYIDAAARVEQMRG